MEATKKRKIANGASYDHLFEKTMGIDMTVKKDANLSHTMALIPKIVRKTLNQSYKIAWELKRDTLEETLRNIWDFTYRHIAYKKDEKGTEQVRSPRRTWADRYSGVDCDCYSTFISSILTNLGIPHALRITKYSQSFFQHIYPIVPVGNRNYITMDCVTDSFDYEVPYSEKKDYPMELQFLNGLGNDTNTFSGPDYIEGIEDGVGELGRVKKKKNSAPAEPDDPNKTPPTKKKKFFGKLLQVVNKVNPAAVLLRNGLLICMKLNIMNVARRLRWSYVMKTEIIRLTPKMANESDEDYNKRLQTVVDKWMKIVRQRQKMESIFTSAGGSASNLKKAMLGSKKGNPDHNKIGHDGKVQGSESVSFKGFAGDEENIHLNIPLPELLGYEIYHSENVEGMENFSGYENFEGFGELGEPITLASIGAAIGVIKGCAAQLKSIGDLFGGKGTGSSDFDEKLTDAPENNPQNGATAAKTTGASDNSDASTSDKASTSNTGDDAQTSLLPQKKKTASEPTTDDSSDAAADTADDSDQDSQATVAKQDSSKDSSDAATRKAVLTTTTPSTTTPTVYTEVTKEPAVNTPPAPPAPPSDTKQSFWDKNKKIILISAGAAVGVFAIVKFMQSRKPEPAALSGFRGKGNKKKTQQKRNVLIM